MSEAEIDAKRQKARRYAQEPERLTLASIQLQMNSEHGTRQIALADGQWTCTCDFWQLHRTCSHIMTVQLLLTGVNVRNGDTD